MIDTVLQTIRDRSSERSDKTGPRSGTGPMTLYIIEQNNCLEEKDQQLSELLARIEKLEAQQ